MFKIPLFVDIDNTVSDHMDRLKRIHKKGLFPIEKFANDPEWVLSDRVIPGSIEAISQLSRTYHICWLSARKKDLLDITRTWLERNNFEIDQIILVDSLLEKIDFLEKNQPSIFIDDLQYDFFSMEPKKATIAISKLLEKNISFVRFEGNWEETQNEIEEVKNCLKK